MRLYHLRITEKIFPAIIVLFLHFGLTDCNAFDYLTKTAILTPVTDTYAYQFGTSAASSENELRVGCRRIDDTTNNIISLLQFDIAELPETSRIKSALLHIYALDTKNRLDGLSFRAIASPENRLESDPEYLAESLSGTPVYNSRCIAGISGTSPDLYLWDITDLVQAWIDGRPNYGIVLTADSKKFNNYIRFYASENPMYKPCIKVMYAAPETSFSIDAVYKNNEVRNIKDTVDSDPARLTVKDPIQILDPPISQTKKSGDTVTFSVSVSGTGPFEYQWKKNGQDIPYAILDNLTLAPIKREDAGVYSCEVSNPFSTVVSTEATLTLTDPPEIVSHPDSQIKRTGESVTFSVSVSGTGPFEYQWKKNGQMVPYAILDSITLAPIEKEDAGVYSCEVSNPFSTVVSREAALSVIEAPVVSAKESGDSLERPSTDPAASFDLLLSPPTGQGQYVRNGNALTFEGTAVPGIILLMASLEDNRDFLIRDIARAVTIDSETGYISGAVFVGSFRGACNVRLNIKVRDPSNNKILKGISNTLSIDNAVPEICITTPGSHAYIETVPITISGSTSDSASGIGKIEISTDGGASYSAVDSFSNGRWQYIFTPQNPRHFYVAVARATDRAGNLGISEKRVIRHKSSSLKNIPSKTTGSISKPNRFIKDVPLDRADKSPKTIGIFTYRIVNLEDNRFEPSELFSLDEEMAIIVKGYGGELVTLKFIDPTAEKVVFELSDYIPANKHKMWKWKLSETGIFKAALFVGGFPMDHVLFKIIQ
jgi:hypothetical protein